MQNDAGEFVDLYDHASIQMNISEVDKVTGRVNGQFKTYAICGAIRRMQSGNSPLLWQDICWPVPCRIACLERITHDLFVT
uniref:Ribosomal protein S21 n=1 Tax=Crocodylus porosus TaxID=8502 RepID=A0A7M4EEP1_CROPO